MKIRIQKILFIAVTAFSIGCSPSDKSSPSVADNTVVIKEILTDQLVKSIKLNSVFTQQEAEEKISYLSQYIHYKLTITSKSNINDINYLAFGLKKNIQLICNGDSVQPDLFIYEGSTPGLNNTNNWVIAFGKKVCFDEKRISILSPVFGHHTYEIR